MLHIHLTGSLKEPISQFYIDLGYAYEKYLLQFLPRGNDRWNLLLVNTYVSSLLIIYLNYIFCTVFIYLLCFHNILFFQICIKLSKILPYHFLHLHIV